MIFLGLLGLVLWSRWIHSDLVDLFDFFLDSQNFLSNQVKFVIGAMPGDRWDLLHLFPCKGVFDLANQPFNQEESEFDVLEDQ